MPCRDRVNALFAVMAVGGNLDIEIVLRGIVEAAVNLVNASYGAMGESARAGRSPSSPALSMLLGASIAMARRQGPSRRRLSRAASCPRYHEVAGQGPDRRRRRPGLLVVYW